MISRERLVSGLKEIIFVEEGMVAVYTNFSSALTRQTEDMPEEKRKEIQKLLAILQRDSAKHKEMVDSLVERIEGENKNEY